MGPSDFINHVEKSLLYSQAMGSAYYRKRSSIPVQLPFEGLSTLVDKPPVIKVNLKTSKILKKQAMAPQQPLKNKGAEKLSPLMLAGRWHDALMLSEQLITEMGPSIKLLQTSAKALANLGRKDEALKRCEQCLAIDPTDKYTYFIEGIVFMEQEMRPKAEAAFRKAIYLDHQFIEAHYQLALLLLHQGQKKAALKSFANARTLAKKCDPLAEVQDAPGITYALFVEMLDKEITVYTS